MPVVSSITSQVLGNAASQCYNTYLFVKRGEPYRDTTFCYNFKRKSIRFGNLKLGVANYRQAAKAFLRKLVPVSVDFDASFFNAQSGHSNLTASQKYGISQYEFINVNEDIRAEFKKCSTTWCSVLQIDNLHTNLESKNKHQDAIKQSKNLDNALLEFLRIVYKNNTMTFRPGQLETVKAILR